jgi:multiple sugar transport system substrate-binding protein
MTRTSRLRLNAVLTAAALLGGLAACDTPTTPAGTAGQPVTITFSSYTYGTQGAAGAGTKKLLEQFAAAHPEITVEAQAVPTADVLTKTKADVAAGDPPDVVQLGYSKLAEAFETLPLQSLEGVAGADWAGHVEGITPALVQTGVHDDQVTALPFTVSIPTVFYNADLFRDAGLDPDRPPTTMTEIRAAAAALKAKGTNGIYFGIADSSKSDYLTQSVLDSAGAATIDDAGQVAFDSPAAIAALTEVQALTTEELQPAVSVDDALASFSSGKLGMLVVSTAVAGNLKQAADGSFELRSTGFPSFADRPAAPTFSGAGLIMLSADAAEQRASWELIKFLTSADGYTTVAKDIGYLPLRAELVDDPRYLKDHFATNKLLLPPLRQLPSVSPYRSFPGKNANQAVVLLQDNAVEPIVLRGADPAQTLRSVADRVRALVSQ